MEFREWYEIHWRKQDGDSGVYKYYELEHVAWDELEVMRKDPNVQSAILFRQQTIQLGSHSKAQRK